MHDQMPPVFLRAVERIYDAALDARLWRRFFSDASRLFNADNVYLSSVWYEEPGLSYEILDENAWEQTPLRRFVSLMNEDPRTPAFRSTIYRPLHCRMVTPEERLRRSRVYKQALAELDIEYTLIVNLGTERGSTRFLGFTRGRAGQPFDDDDCALLGELTPHLRRTLEIQERIDRIDRDRAAVVETLERLPMGVVVVDESGCVRMANHAARKIAAAPGGFSFCGRRVKANESKEDVLLAEAIGRATIVDDPMSPSSGVVEMSAGEAGVPLTLHVRGAGNGLAVLTASLPAVHAAPTSLQRAFGLSPAQARLAALLQRGCSLKEASRRLGITEGSARQYLKIIFRKTGTNRQVDLIRLMGALR